jgi:hypothetical protein
MSNKDFRGKLIGNYFLTITRQCIVPVQGVLLMLRTTKLTKITILVKSNKMKKIQVGKS